MPKIKRKKTIYEKCIKRPLDIIMSLVAIVIFSPVMLVVAILVRVKLGTPVIFKQKRPGLNEKIFTMYKFRTMTDKKDANGDLLPDSERLTNFGKKLRATSMDELPELFNILKGDMSVVGPRPLLVEYLPYYTKRESLRHKIRPGLTGLAQVSGRNYLDWDARLSKDIEYLFNISLMIDIKIIFKTAEKVLRKEDILYDTSEAETNLAIERATVRL